MKSLKKEKNEQKILKKAEKKVSTCFQVRAAPKSWLQYTTDMQRYKKDRIHFSIAYKLIITK